MFNKLIKFGSLNVRGLNDYKKRKSIFNYMIRNNVDICLLQETHFNKNNVNIIKQEWQG